MSSVAEYVYKKIAGARVFEEPYPFIYVPGIFPEAYFQQIRAHLPEQETYKTLHEYGRVLDSYSKKRIVVPMAIAAKQPDRFFKNPDSGEFWSDLVGWLLSTKMMITCLKTFGKGIYKRYPDGGANAKWAHESLLIRDSEAYELGPHTDSHVKVLSFLFYLPATSEHPHLGTSIYKPKNPNFRCRGGPHYEFKDYDRLCTMPFLPNTLFGFLKTDHSFHGVEPVAAGFQRDILLYDIKDKNA